MGAAGTGPFSGNSDLHQGQMIGGMRFIGWNSFVGRNWTYFAPYLLKELRNEKSKKKIFGEGWSHPNTGREVRRHLIQNVKRSALLLTPISPDGSLSQSQLCPPKGG